MRAHAADRVVEGGCAQIRHDMRAYLSQDLP